MGARSHRKELLVVAACVIAIAVPLIIFLNPAALRSQLRPIKEALGSVGLPSISWKMFSGTLSAYTAGRIQGFSASGELIHSRTIQGIGVDSLAPSARHRIIESVVQSEPKSALVTGYLQRECRLYGLHVATLETALIDNDLLLISGGAVIDPLQFKEHTTIICEP